MQRRIVGPAAAAAVAVGGLLVGTGPAQAAAPAATTGAAAAAPVVVVNKLNNPRQLSWADKGHRQLLIAEAGHGGTAACFTGEGGKACAGLTGSISLVYNPALREKSRPYRLVKNLLSFASEDGSAATGPDGVSARGLDAIYIAETWAPPKLLPAAGPYRKYDGKLLLASRSGPVPVADIAKVELTRNPDGQDVNPNPYATLALPDGRVLVADAGGNDIIAVKNGRTSVLTLLPRHGCGGHFTAHCDGQAVPTSLALGPDGNIYVGELAHFEPGAARVWKLSPSGKILSWRGGFSTITGVAFGSQNELYVSQLLAPNPAGGPPGLVTKVMQHSNARTSMPVPLPGGVAADMDGNVFVSAWSIAPASGVSPAPGAPKVTGQVWKVRF